MTTFNGVLQSSTYDHGRAAFYRKQEQERRERDLAERAARWLAGTLGGLEFQSLAGLEEIALQAATHWHGEITEEQATAIRRACTLLWLGEVTRDASFRLTVSRTEGGLRFVAAA